LGKKSDQMQKRRLAAGCNGTMGNLRKKSQKRVALRSNAREGTNLSGNKKGNRKERHCRRLTKSGEGGRGV